MKGRYKPGESGNPKGRPQGATNIITRPLKEQLSDFLNEKIQDELPAIWKKLSAKDQAQFLKDLWPYFMARLQSQSIDLNMNLENLTEEQLIFICNTLFKKDDNEKR